MEKTQNHYDRIAGVFFFCVGAFFFFFSCTIEVGAWNEPGPGFLPFCGGITLVMMSIALLARTWKRKGLFLPPLFPESDSWKRVTATFVHRSDTHRHARHTTLAVTFGDLNYAGREFVRACRAAKEPLPCRRAILKRWPVPRKKKRRG